MWMFSQTGVNMRKILLHLLFLIITAACVSLKVSGVAEANHTPQHTAAENTYGMAKGKYGNSGAFKQNIANPMTSNSTQMTTMDGTKSFDAQLSCPATASFIDVSIAVAATGDLTVTVAQDTNFDGALDVTMSAPAAVSGVCANGVITCNPGTWISCSYYEWQANPITYAISLQPVPMTQLGGCNCVNSSCVPGGYSDYSSILQGLGGGVAGAVQTVDARFSVSKATTTATTISYYGQDTSCSTGSTTSSSLQVYYNTQDSAGLTANMNTEVLTQAADPTSAYSNSKQVYDNTAPGITMNNCDITRMVALNTNNIIVSGGGPSVTICTDHYLYSRINETLNVDGTATYNMDILDVAATGVNHQGCDAGGSAAGGWHPVETVPLPRQASNIYFCVTANGAGCNVGVPACISAANAQTLVLMCTAAGNQYPAYTYTYSLEYQEDVLAESVVDNCATLAADSACSLKTETVDGVVTLSNFIATGDFPSTTCNTYTGADPHTVCRNDWLTSRTYFCTAPTAGGPTYDFSGVQSRAASVKGSLLQSGTSASYTDYRANTAGGAFTFTSETMTMAGTDTAPPCIDVCKIEIPATNTQAGLAGTTADFKTSNTGKDIFFKECSAGVCPLDTAAGEVMLLDCACADGFAEAASIMTALQEAGKDLICSSSGAW